MVGGGLKITPTERRRMEGWMDGWAYLVHVGSDEFHRLVEGVSVAGASVEDDGADGDVGQDVRVVVDEIQGVEHGFQPLDALLLLDGSAGEFQATAAQSGPASRSSSAAVVRQHQVLVHGKQSAKDYVARNADQVVGVLALPLRLMRLLLRRVVLLESEGQLARGGRHHHEKHGGRQPQPSPGATQQFLLHGWQRRRSCCPNVSTCPVIRFNSRTHQPARPAPKPLTFFFAPN